MATTTDLKKLKINYLTQTQYDTALENDEINDDELYMTPDQSTEPDLVARLEQLTYTEQMVKANADATDEIGAQALYTAMMTDTLLEEE